MAKGRMVEKRISVSEQVGAMSHDAQLIFTWSITHADDIGLIPGTTRTLKALIVPLWDITLETFEARVQEILGQNLWVPYDFVGQGYYFLPGFNRGQTLKKDRQPFTYLPLKFSKDFKASWRALEDLGFQMGSNLEPEEKGREGKRILLAAQPPLGFGISVKKTNPFIHDLMDFWTRAVRVIQKIEPLTMDGGKVGSLLKRRMEVDMIAPDRIERLAIWYLSRTSRYKNTSGEWQTSFKHAPDFAVMLSDAFFSKLISDEGNALTYMRENSEWISKLYERPSTMAPKGLFQWQNP